MTKLNARKLPLPALMLSGLVMGLGVVVNIVSPDKAFAYITAVGTCAGLWTWLVILAAHLRYRAEVRRGNLPANDFRMPGAPLTNWFAIAALLFVLVLIANNADTRIALYVWAVWFALLCVGYGFTRRTTGDPTRT